MDFDIRVIPSCDEISAGFSAKIQRDHRINVRQLAESNGIDPEELVGKTVFAVLIVKDGVVLKDE